MFGSKASGNGSGSVTSNKGSFKILVGIQFFFSSSVGIFGPSISLSVSGSYGTPFSGSKCPGKVSPVSGSVGYQVSLSIG